MRLLRSLSVCLLIALPAYATPGAWVQDEGHGIAILNSYYYATDHYFDRGGHSRSQPDFDKLELNPYVEYGLTQDWTVGGSLYLDHLAQDDGRGDTATNDGLGNSNLFARYQLYRDSRFAASLEPFVGLPSLYRHSREPRSGHDDFDAGMLASGGVGFEALGEHHYAEARAGYRKRFGALGDQWILEGKLGLGLAPKWTLMPEFDAVLPAGGVGESGRSVAGSNDYQLNRVQLSLLYDWDEVWSVEAGAFDHPSGRNTGGGGGGLLSLWRRF